METPAPVDLNKLKTILGNAKKIMKASDEKFPNKKLNQNISEDYESYKPVLNNYDESDEKELNYPSGNSNSGQSVRDYTREDIINSKLPDVIKEAMLKKPIPKPSMSFSKFNLDDLGDLVDKPANKKPNVKINETVSKNENLITITVDQLNEMIDKRVTEVISKLFVKTLTEQTIKKTVSTLLNEGKLKK